jgi:hypothetical protein
LLTVNGRIETRRVRWHEAGASSDMPVDRLLDAAESVVSLGTRELCCRLGIAGGSFARAAQNLDQAARVKMSEEKFRQVVESEGRAVLAAGECEQLELDFSAAECKVTTAEGKEVSRIYAGCDGVLAPVTTQAEKDKRRATVMKKRRENRPKKGQKRGRLPGVKKGADQRFKQFYLTVFYDQTHEKRLVGVTRKDHKGLGRLLKREASRILLLGAVERIGLIDGAICLRNRMEELPLTALGLDFFHLSGHVHEGGRATFGDENPEGTKWSGQMLHTVRHEGYEPFWEKLTDWRSEQRGGKRKEADALLHYVAQRKEMIAYDQFEKQGWHIGSGPIEAMCKATTRRIKGPGMRWDRDNAEAMMALEALYQSNLWDKYWANALSHAN